MTPEQEQLQTLLTLSEIQFISGDAADKKFTGMHIHTVRISDRRTRISVWTTKATGFVDAIGTGAIEDRSKAIHEFVYWLKPGRVRHFVKLEWGIDV